MTVSQQYDSFQVIEIIENNQIMTHWLDFVIKCILLCPFSIFNFMNL